jgi:ATP-dependent DNA helicase PIF1
MKRTQQQLSRLEVTTFNSALRIYGKKIEVKAYNHEKIRDLGEPVLDITAGYSPDAAKARKASYEDAGNLHGTLGLCLGARVMLVENLWTGLVNGATGTVTDIVWEAAED